MESVYSRKCSIAERNQLKLVFNKPSPALVLTAHRSLCVTLNSRNGIEIFIQEIYIIISIAVTVTRVARVIFKIRILKFFVQLQMETRK